MQHDGQKKICRLSYALLVLLLPASAGAAPTTAEQAERVVQRWLSLDRRPLEAELGSVVADVEAYNDQYGQPLYYVVNLAPKGFVIISGDTDVEPIIAFSPEGKYDPSEKNPLGALVSRDLPGRVRSARASQAAGGFASPQKAAVSGLMNAQEKWNWLEQGETLLRKAGLTAIDDLRVPPLLASKWDQSTISGTDINLYNLYTPNNYVSGCVATAMSQVMRYFEHPTAGVDNTIFYEVFSSLNDQSPKTSHKIKLSGGDGSGGPYVWSNMPLVPNAAITESEKNAIGRLLSDAGASVCMGYTQEEGSGALTATADYSLVKTFLYSNSIYYSTPPNGNISSEERNKMTNPNLDAGHPVMYGITNSTGGGGHAIVCDGYGYNASTMYHHLNMGWSGSDDAWYNLPNIDNSDHAYQNGKISDCIYNIYTSGTGEIISGRVTDSSGQPIAGVVITATGNGGNYTASTNTKGIYALKQVPSASTYEISASKSGYTFTTKSVSTGTSKDEYEVSVPVNLCAMNFSSSANTVGNVWGADFTGGAANNEPEIDIRGNGSSIASGDTSPSKSDHTDFGATPIGTPVSRTYTVANTGGVMLTEEPVELTGSDCSEFSITSQPTTSVAAGGTSTFTIRYNPTDSGDSDTCTVSIGNSDSDENPYTFMIKGAEGIEKLPGWLPAVYDLLM